MGEAGQTAVAHNPGRACRDRKKPLSSTAVSLDLIGRIYDCALDSARWPAVLAELSDAVNGTMADLGVVDPVASTFRVHAVHNWPGQVLALAMHNQHINPTLPLAATARVGEPMCSSRDLDIEAFHRSTYWQRCFAAGDYYDYLLVVLTKSTAAVGSWGVVGNRSRGAFDDADLEFARAVSPHIQRAVQIAGVLDYHRMETATLSSALDTVAAAAVIVDDAGRIVYTNDEADREIQSGRLIGKDQQGRIRGLTADAVRLVDSLVAFAAGAARQAPYGKLAAGADRALLADAVRLEVRAGLEGRRAMLLLREPDAELSTPLGTAAEQFALSRAETQVLGQLMNGATLAEAADCLGVARSTVKSQLEAIYGKTGARRRAELVRMVMGLTRSVAMRSPQGPDIAR